MHVLSVSGLHVALIYMILGFLLAFLKRGKAGLILFAVIMISFLWVYAFLSGFSPPVQRATVMFTFVIIGENLRRPVNIYNSLTASALLLILLNPNVLFDVGFQLSYLAIFGIVLIQPVLYNMIDLNNPALKWLWALFTVSVAAQLITFPLGLFYFNQFPNLFWLSNFIVVPVTTFIMWFTLAYFVFVPFQALAAFIGIIIQKLTWFMLAALKIMDAHPLAVSKGIVLNAAQVFIIYGIIVSVLIYGFSKQKQWLFYGLFLILALQITELGTKYKLLNQKHIYVYNSRNTIIHLINGRNNYVVVSLDSIPENDARTIQKVIDHLRLNKPIVINRFNPNGFKNHDCLLQESAIQFLNSTLEFQKKPAYINTDQISLQIQNNNSMNNKTDTINLSTGNLSLKRRNSPAIDFSTKTQGAYHLELK
jgi:competence protein ComEC